MSKKKQTGITQALTAAGIGFAVTAAASLVAAAIGAKLLASPGSASYIAIGCLALGCAVAAFVGGKRGDFVQALCAGGILTALFAIVALVLGGLTLLMPASAIGGTLTGTALTLNRPSKSKKQLTKLRKRK